MHTGHSLIICQSLLLPRVGLLWVSAPGSVSAPRGCLLLGGVCSRGVYPSMHWGRHSPPRGQNSWHMLLKILPWPNFVAAGNNTSSSTTATCFFRYESNLEPVTLMSYVLLNVTFFREEFFNVFSELQRDMFASLFCPDCLLSVFPSDSFLVLGDIP